MTDAAGHKKKEKKSLAFAKLRDIMPFKRLYFSCHVACQPGVLQGDNAGAVTEVRKACGQGRKLDMGAQGAGKGRERNEEVSGIGTESVCGRNRISGAVELGRRGERDGDSKRTAGEDRKGEGVARGQAKQETLEKLTTFSSQRAAAMNCCCFLRGEKIKIPNKLSLKYESFNNHCKSVNRWFRSSGDLSGGDLRGVDPSAPLQYRCLSVHKSTALRAELTCGNNHQDSDPASTTI